MGIVFQMFFKPPRRRMTLEERTTPCFCCGFPISQRHHGIPVSVYGEMQYVAYLCANCHELLHLLEKSAKPNQKRARELLDAYKAHYGENEDRLEYLQLLIDESDKAEAFEWSESRRRLSERKSQEGVRDDVGG